MTQERETELVNELKKVVPLIKGIIGNDDIHIVITAEKWKSHIAVYDIDIHTEYAQAHWYDKNHDLFPEYTDNDGWCVKIKGTEEAIQ